MILHFPLKDVTVKKVTEPRAVVSPDYADDFWQMNQREFAMQVEGVGRYYACDGREVEYTPVKGASRETLELYLNGSVYGAILHQRKILPLHGSSFVLDGKGILVCGEAGAGKSSVTASFVFNGAGFLTDDVTPMVIREGVPMIMALSDRIKLWDDTLKQLGLKNKGLKKIAPDNEKYYYPVSKVGSEYFPLNMVFIISAGHEAGVLMREVTGADKFVALRNEIYRWEYLEGMKENEEVYFRTLSGIASTVKVFAVRRSDATGITELRETLEKIIAGQ